MDELFISIGYIGSVAAMPCTLIPPFELWMNVFGPESIWDAIPTLVSSLILQSMCWTILLGMLQFVALKQSKEGEGHVWSNKLFAIYSTMAFSHQCYSIIPITLGSPIYNFV